MAATARSLRVIHFASFRLDVSSGELTKNSTRIRLPEQPFQILTLLLERPGEVVSREELQQKLWSTDTFVDFDTGLNSAIKKLRDALGDSAETPRFVETLPRRGYRFIYPVETDVAEPPPPAPWWRRPRAAALLALVPLALLAVLLAGNVGGWRDRLLGGPNVGPVDSLAVLPSKNLTGDPEQEYLADAMTDVLTTHLAQVKTLFIPSVTSSMHYKGTRKKLPEIAHELKVKAVVEPSVQRSGERLEINVQLIYGPTDRHLWARLYECDRKDVQKILSKVAQDLISELKVQATKDEMARVSSSKQVSHEAYETYLKGLYHLRKGTRAERTKAREHFEKAIELDPSFARPYASLAFMYAHGGVVRVGEGELADRSAVRQWASKALELDETLAQAHSALGWVDLSDWNWRDAEQEFKRAIELNPNLSGARAWYAQFLGALQRYDEAFAQAKVAQELDPASPDLVSHAVWAYYVAGRVDEAMTRWRAVVDLEPNYWGAHFFLAQGYLTKGMYQEAIAELQKSISVSERSHANLRYLAYAYAKSGQRSEALKIISEMETRNLRVSALVYVGLGDKDKALAQLEKNYENHGAGLFFANTDPLLQPLHNDPRFQDLMRRVGLPTAKAK